MKATHVTEFAGRTGKYKAGFVPEKYRVAYDAANSFERALAELCPATTEPVYYHDEDRGEYVEIVAHKAVVNPEWLGDGLDDAPKQDAAWYVHTNSYDPVLPSEAFGPLSDAAEEAGTSMFGTIREYRNGGEVHIDAFFPSYTVDYPSPDGSDMEDLILGLNAGTDYYGRQRVHSEVIAFDPNNRTVLRGLSEANKRKHTKARDEDGGYSAAKTAAWWAEELARMDTVSDALYQLIYEAQEYTVDFDGIPFGPKEFYEVLGIPTQYAKKASSRFVPEALDSKDYHGKLSAWHLSNAVMHALEREYNGKTDGRAFKTHVSNANRIMFHPSEAEASAMESFAIELEEEDDDGRALVGTGQLDLNGEPISANLRERAETAAERMGEYVSLKERIKSMVRDAEESSDDGQQTVTADT